MKPKDFKGRTHMIAEKQEEFITLPARILSNGTTTNKVETHWEFNPEELEELNKSNELVLIQYLPANLGFPPMDFHVFEGVAALEEAKDEVVLSKDTYDKLLTAMNGCKRSMSAHPDCEKGSEFADMVGRCNDVMNIINNSEITKALKETTDTINELAKPKNGEKVSLKDNAVIDKKE